MTVRFLFMDEKYADLNAPRPVQVVSLTGVLISPSSHKPFREKFYELVSNGIGDPENVISGWPHEHMHAARLLPDSTDEERIFLLQGLVTLVHEFDFKIYRVGYFNTRKARATFSDEKGIVGLCFVSMLYALRNESSQVWPVMETDRSSRQEMQFSGVVQVSDYMASRFGSDSMWLSKANFGEVLFTTKRSTYGALTDCMAYLLHANWLRTVGRGQTPYKERLADIASQLLPAVAMDEVARLRVGVPDEKMTS